jgi:hemerythrin superfamily protein
MVNTAETNPWADTPFTLLKIPGQLGGPVCANSSVLSVAIEMANVHNVLLRPLNAIYHQAPFVQLSSDIADFMLYVTAWADTLHHHHSLEESLLFPRVEEIAKEAGMDGWDGLMGGNVEQHHEFEPKIAGLVKWAEEVVAGERTYDAAELKRRIDDFAPVLTQHLHDEIDTLIKLEKCDGEKVKQAMKETADEGAKTADPVRTPISSLTTRYCITALTLYEFRTLSSHWYSEVSTEAIQVARASRPFPSSSRT